MMPGSCTVQRASSALRIVEAVSKTHCLVNVRLHRIVEGQLAMEFLEILSELLPLVRGLYWNREVLLHIIRELTAGVGVGIKHGGQDVEGETGE